MDKPNVWSICATSGRHQLVERSLACFLAQDYDGPHTLLIYNNSEVAQDLPSLNLPDNKSVVLVNCFIDRETNESYTNLGAIYRDALQDVDSQADIITHQDDDDLFLPNHISEGVKGYQKAQSSSFWYRAYKPEQSWFRHASGIERMGNNLEPSIFVEADYIRKYGYKLTTTDQHFGWFGPLLENDELYIDKEGIPTLIYNWGDVNIPTFKTSGNAGSPNNFNNYRVFSQDHGDQVITPLSREELQKYYDEVPTSK